MLVPADKIHLFYPLGSHFIQYLKESGYFHLQATKPDTIGVALSDSPVGLAAYITWTRKSGIKDADGDLLDKFTEDELLDNVMIYWVTNSITTSMRLYSEVFNFKVFNYPKLDSIGCEVPTGVAIFPEDLQMSSEPVARLKFKQLISYKIMPKGGHFTAYEEPILFFKDINQYQLVSQVEKL